MADLSDVLTSLVNIVAGAIYPNGTSAPSAVIVGSAAVPARIYPGWPLPAPLDADLAAGLINVSVYAPSGMERNTTRYPLDQETLTLPVHTLTVAIDGTGTAITIGGTVAVPQNVAALVNGSGFVYEVQAGDTLISIAAALAALINAVTPATSSGPVITIPAAKRLIARVGSTGTSITEIRRQDRQFQIVFWCPTPAARDAAVKLVDPVLAALKFISLADGTAGRLIYQRTFLDDAIQKAGCWRRDLFYSVEYGTTITETDTEIVDVRTSITGGVDPAAPPIITFDS